MKCLNIFVQSTVSARRQGDENANSNVVTEAMNLLANSSYGNQLMDRSRHSVTKYMNDEKTDIAINKNFQEIGAHQRSKLQGRDCLI